MAKMDLSHSERIRNQIISQERTRIRTIYKSIALFIVHKSNVLDKKSSYDINLHKLESELIDMHDKATDNIGLYIVAGMKIVSDAVMSDTMSFINSVGINTSGLYSNLPEQVINSIINGDIYNSLPNGTNWTLSGAIWDNKALFNGDIHKIITDGMAQNKSAYDIAKDLEKYVNGSVAKDFDWGKVYPGTRKVVDYNAQRLARTMVSHSYQYTFVKSTHYNPFVEGYIWHSGHTDRTCEICSDRDGQFYQKGQLPLDHPNGLCYWEAAIPMSMLDISDRIADWANGGNDPDLDNYFEFLYFETLYAA